MRITRILLAVICTALFGCSEPQQKIGTIMEFRTVSAEDAEAVMIEMAYSGKYKWVVAGKPNNEKCTIRAEYK
jgi:hypothetical protein